MNTFEKHYERFPDFVNKIKAWKPDYIVPVAKKGCKLLKASNIFKETESSNVKYKIYFELNHKELSEKKVAILDDATQFTSTLKEYRNFFENKGARVRTFSFVGHNGLKDGSHIKYDEEAEIEIYLSEPVYQEYILQQTYFLLKEGCHYDIDHIIFKSKIEEDRLNLLISELRKKGVLIFQEDYFLGDNIRRFVLIEFDFFNSIPFFSNDSIENSPIKKIKFVVQKNKNEIYFSPLIFPIWKYKDKFLNNNEFSNIPFKLPFNIPENLAKVNKFLIRRIYDNIRLTYTICLAKSFFQEFIFDQKHVSGYDLVRNDLDAVYGEEISDQIIRSTKGFIADNNIFDFTRITHNKSKKYQIEKKYNNFGQIINDLKKGYEEELIKRGTHVGIHFYMSYEYIFNSYFDNIELNDNIDYYCDLGAIVPETGFYNNKVQRLIRTGENDSEYAWKRTQVIIPLVILLSNRKTMKPTLLDKLLANFVYDYPSFNNIINHELHCLITEPGPFGAIVKVHHRSKANSKPTIYQSNRISDYYFFDNSRKEFVVKKEEELMKEISKYFDDKTAISYSEIINYFNLLLEIYNKYKDVSYLNIISISREEQYYYSHLMYNLLMWIEEYNLYLDDNTKNIKIKSLAKANENIKSLREKITFKKRLPNLLKNIDKEFKLNPSFIKSIERIKEKTKKYSKKFKDVFDFVSDIIELMRFINNVSLFYENKLNIYLKIINEYNNSPLFRKYGIKQDIPIELLIRNEKQYKEFTKKYYEKIIELRDSLPPEEELMMSRIRIDEIKNAENIATRYVNKNKLNELLILHTDFTGYKKVPEPKKDYIYKFYEIIKKNMSGRNGKMIYDGSKGDDAFSIIFSNMKIAIEFASVMTHK